jgi:hypothetical protein
VWACVVLAKIHSNRASDGVQRPIIERGRTRDTTDAVSTKILFGHKGTRSRRDRGPSEKV